MQRLVRRALSSASSSTTSPLLYCVRTHTWLQQRSSPRLARIGLTDRALDDIGEVEAVQNLVSMGESVDINAEMLKIDWEAMSISDGDELYHTRWANITGSHFLKAPVAGEIVAVNDAALRVGKYGGVIDADAWLVELSLENGADLSHLCNADEYEEKARESGGGAFGASDDTLTYSSYG